MVQNDPADGDSHKSAWYNCNDDEGIRAVYGVDEVYDSDDEDEEEDEENFADYMWMENIEEFDNAEMQRLEEEAMTKDCMEACRDDKSSADELTNEESMNETDVDVSSGSEITSDMFIVIQNAHSRMEEGVLNPLAPVFVPAFAGVD